MNKPTPTKNMYTATIDFNSRQKAQDFATRWSRFTLRGYSLSSTRLDGQTSVTLDKVTPTDRQWINNRVAMMNAAAEREAELSKPEECRLEEESEKFKAY
jgi:hypothetical protein